MQSIAINRPPETSDRLFRKAVSSLKIVSVATFLSRILGLVRDMALAFVFGATWVTDAFVIAYVVPNLSRRIFGEGAMTSAFIPEFANAQSKEGKAAAESLLGNVLTYLTLILVALSLLIALVALLWSYGFVNDDSTGLALVLLLILLPSMVFLCSAAVISGALNTLGRFLYPALAPAVQNVAWIAAIFAAYIIFSGEVARVIVMSLGVVLGTAISLAILALDLRGKGYRIVPSFALSPRLKKIALLMAPSILGIAVFQVNTFLDSIFAWVFVEGSGAAAHLYYGNRLMQFPLAMIGVAMSTAVFPLLSKLASTGENARFREIVVKSLRMVLFLTIPAAVGLFMIAGDVVRVFFANGSFTDDAADRTITVTWCYVLGLTFTCVQIVVTKCFHARGEPKTPMRVALWLVGLNLVMNLILVRTPLAEAGLALSTSVCAAIGVAMLLWRLRTLVGGLELRLAIRPLLQSAFASALMVAMFWITKFGLAGVFARMGAGRDVLELFLLVSGAVASAAFYFAFMYVVGSRELDELLNRPA
ncbi:MAG: murein biosynthesis integral membrane protein MurJ [Planctomycetes bacterium]|nr:murein biosynthesis integral membrane protein MurJ [Planctomycetota bacterium]